MTVKNVSDAKAELSALLVLVENGEEVVISRAGKPVAKLVAMETARPERVLGRLRGQIWTSEDFDAPSSEIEALFHGEES